jgi:CDP-diacylglycerol--glycerol-3-phosphate 3-phosphatidyltransferase
MDKLIDPVRNAVRSFMGGIAKDLDKLSGGRISPNAITMTGLLAHVYIAWLIAFGANLWAALFLIIFGLFDTLDGQLARLQKRASNAGMLLDATTDRMKEVLLYGGIAYFYISSTTPTVAVWAVLACGGSLLVSYVKAKGEMAVKDSKLSPNEINRLFQDGFLRFEIRMFLLVIGLLTGYVSYAVILIAILAWFTAFQRLYIISKKL